MFKMHLGLLVKQIGGTAEWGLPEGRFYADLGERHLELVCCGIEERERREGLS